jgi:nucleoid DNA-binding protein
MTDKNTEREIATILAAQLKKHARIQINGLGTFSVEHKKQEQLQENDGRVVMKPPTDVIVFTHEK